MKFIRREGMKITYEMDIRERAAIYDVLSAVLDCMEWDEEGQDYKDNGQFLLSLSKSDVENLKRVVDVL